MALIHRLGERDRALFDRLRLDNNSHRQWCALAVGLTHLGSAGTTIALALAPLLVPGWHVIGRHALYTLVLSHVFVQLVKRTVSRPRPSCALGDAPLICVPDRFSFPSGHAAAAVSIALAYSAACPEFAIAILALAGVVGATRVALGVHYPGDVAAGQSIAVATHLILTHFNI
ncbi:MAG: phosphatase PAP2 family protein [bacterium]